MSIIEKLNIASFRQVQFLVSDSSTDRGQKVAIHEYPNSDKRFAEPLGKLPPIFKLTGIVHGDDAFQKRKNLESALEENGRGELVHPIYGAITVQALPYTISENQREIGKFIFSMEFAASEASIEPNPIPATPETVTNQADLCRDNLDNALEDSYLNPDTASELDSLSDNMNGVLDDIQDSVNSVVGPIQSAVADVNSSISNFKNKVFRIMQTAAGLKDSIRELYANLESLVATPSLLKTAWDNLLTVNIGSSGNTSDAPAAITSSRTKTANDNSIVDEHTRITGMIGSYESSSYTEFNTETELVQTLSELDDFYTKYFEDERVLPDGVVSLANNPDVRDSVATLRVLAKESIQSQLTNIWRVVDIDSGKTSMSLFNHRFYGNLDNVDSVSNLNKDNNVSNFNQTIKAVTK